MSFLNAIEKLKASYETEYGRSPKYLILSDMHRKVLESELKFERLDGLEKYEGVAYVLEMQVISATKYLGTDFRWGFGE